MSSKPQPDSRKNSSDNAADRKPLPFELSKRSKLDDKKAEKKPAKPTSVALPKKERNSKGSPEKSVRKSSRDRQSSRTDGGIPEVVSRRMIRRMALLSGVPSALGMSTFIVSYLVVSNDLIRLPNYAVLLVSLGWFGLGVLGLSYGVLSASWDEASPGSKLGWTEFTVNWGRMTQAWRSPRKP